VLITGTGNIYKILVILIFEIVSGFTVVYRAETIGIRTPLRVPISFVKEPEMFSFLYNLSGMKSCRIRNTGLSFVKFLPGT
jgi:hypothetical protein